MRIPTKFLLSQNYVRKHGKMTIRMAYEMVMPYHLHMPSYFLETFTEYPYIDSGVLLLLYEFIA